MNLRDETVLLTADQVARRIKFSTHTIGKWTSKKLSGWPMPIPCGPQRERRWREIDIARWVRHQASNPAPKRRQGALAPKIRKAARS